MTSQHKYLLGLVTTLAVFFLLSQANFLVFHISIELSTFMVGLVLLLFISLSIKKPDDNFLVLITYGFFTSGLVLLLHMFSYEGTEVFRGFGSNEATQFWLVSNLILAVSIHIAVLYSHKIVNPKKFGVSLLIITILLSASVFLGIFPEGYNEGSGLTLFKKITEYFIASIYIITLYSTYKRSNRFNKNFYIDLMIVLFLFAIAEVLFTLYVGVYDLPNIFGHMVKFTGLYIFLLAVIKEFLIKPVNNSFVDMRDEIDEFHKSFKILAKNEETFRTLYDDAPLGYQSLDENGYYIIVNETFAKMLGYRKDQMIGKHFSEFMTNDSSLTLNDNFKAFKQRGSVDVIFNMIHKKGHIIPIRFMGKIALKADGEFKQTHCILMDISTEVEYQKGIIESKEKLNDIINLTSEGVYSIDTNGICISINEKALDLLGFKNKEAVLGKNIHKVIHGKSIKKGMKPPKCFAFDVMASGLPLIKSAKRFWKTNGHTFDVEVSVIPLTVKDKVIGATVSFRDTTTNSNIVNSLINLTYHDLLTGVFNRRYYEEEIVNLDKDINYPLSIIVCDINGLKLVNDAFGHYAGDKLLISAVKVFAHHAKNNDFIARLGGDEFAIVMPKTSKDEVEKRVAAMIESCKNYDVKSVELSISFGHETKENDRFEFDNVYKAAEDSMYRMKLLDVPSMRSNTIDTILQTLYEKDNYSEVHSQSVSKICEAIAEKCNLSYQQVNKVKMAGILHDIGKIVVSRSLINKDGKLTSTEYEEIKSHSDIGFRILNSSSELRQLSTIVLSHHEHWNGLGYPQKLKGEEIPYLSRIISVADAFDAMTSDRTYRDKLSYEDALLELIRCSGTQFDPEIVKVFEENFQDIISTISK